MTWYKLIILLTITKSFCVINFINMFIIKIILSLLLPTTTTMIIIIISSSYADTSIINDSSRKQCSSHEYNSKRSDLDIYWINLERSVDRRQFMIQQVIIIIIIIIIIIVIIISVTNN